MPNDKYTRVPDDAASQIERLGDSTPAHYVGVDVGTSKVVAAMPRGRGVDAIVQLNAFIPVPYSKFTEKIINDNGISYYRNDDELIIYGTATEKFANMFNANARRPMADGLLNPRERAAMPVLEAILQSILPKARSSGDTLAFSVPAAVEGRDAEKTYHEATLRRYFDSLGYKAIAINEGLAVVFAELGNENFTGIGISCGGGMCNVALAYLSIPSIMFSIPKGGDFIDQSVGTVVNEHATRVKVIKEEGLDLSRPPKDKFEKALHIYYEDLVESLVDALRRHLASAEKLPKTDRPIPIVLAGGTARPKGFREMFERSLRARSMPIDIASVRLAADPVTATARGALIAAEYEK